MRHGPAAKSCECGQSLVVVEPPAPPKTFFILSAFFFGVTVWSARLAEKNGWIYFPLGGLLFASVALVLGLRSWLWFKRNGDE